MGPRRLSQAHGDRASIFEKEHHSSIVFTSMRGRADVERTFRIIYPLFVPYAKGRCAPASAGALVAAAGGAGANVAITGVAALQRTNKRANQSDAGVARNMLALSSMTIHASQASAAQAQEDEERARRHAAMLDSIRGGGRARKRPHLVAVKPLDDAEANALVDEQDRFQ